MKNIIYVSLTCSSTFGCLRTIFSFNFVADKNDKKKYLTSFKVYKQPGKKHHTKKKRVVWFIFLCITLGILLGMKCNYHARCHCPNWCV